LGVWGYSNFSKTCCSENIINLNHIKIYNRNSFSTENTILIKDVIMSNQSFLEITPELAHQLIAEQFPQYAHLPVTSVEQQGHDNRTYRLGSDLLIRMPRAESYALKVPKEQNILPKLAPYLSVNIPVPIEMGKPSLLYPYPFSIYKWLEGRSINLFDPDVATLEQLAFELAHFLKELQSIKGVDGPEPGQHNWWRGDHVSVYDKGAREQIALLDGVINSKKAIELWQQACSTRWSQLPVWIHGDVAIGNILMSEGKLSAIIDFGGMSLGDPACDLVIAWTYFTGKAREIFITEIDLDEETWLRARGWALWKATYQLCQITDKNSPESIVQKKIIQEVIES
jgi:aminoglycoside phosphotransferase (APT) family kinase protein